MRAAVIAAAGASPSLIDFPRPEPSGDQVVVDVGAAGLNPLDVHAAQGRLGPPPQTPYVIGREGVGRTTDGERVYFDGTVAPYGSLAEQALVDQDHLIPVSDEVADEAAIALGIAGIAAWMALERSAKLRAGEHVLVLGAGGAVGQIAVQAARLLGASRVSAVRRKPNGRTLVLGADDEIRLGDGEEFVAELSPDSYHVVVDMLWGKPAVASLALLAPEGRLIQVGASYRHSAEISPVVLRRKRLAIIGHANFIHPLSERRATLERLLDLAAADKLRVAVARLPLTEIAAAWRDQIRGPGRKLVLVP